MLQLLSGTIKNLQLSIKNYMPYQTPVQVKSKGTSDSKQGAYFFCHQFFIVFLRRYQNFVDRHVHDDMFSVW